MAEFQNLAKLLETMRSISEAKESVEAAKTEEENATTELKAAATEKLNECQKKLEKLQETEKELRQIACTFMIPENKEKTELTEGTIDSTAETKDTDFNVLSAPPPRTPSFNFKLPKPEKFKKPENKI